MALLQIAACMGIGMAHGMASAQWMWLDGNGNKVFSDTAPPMGTPDKNIIRRPGAGAPKAAPSPASTAKPEEADAAKAPAKPSAAANELEAKKKQAEEAEKAKQKAEEEKVAKARADNCQRARQGKAAFESGVRLSTVNAQGERVVMDEKMRASEQQRLQQIIQSDCAR